VGVDNTYREFVISKLLANIDIIANNLSDDIVNKFVEELSSNNVDNQVDDPAHPLHYINEFRDFLIEEISNVDRHTLTDFGISIHTGDGPRLGFDEALDADETDAIKIIGTVIQGISGEYILVLTEQAKIMFGRKFDENLMGRFGGAFVMPVDEYIKGMNNYGWPEAQIWEFSNFPGIPDLFDGVYVEKSVEKSIEEIMSLT
jgi:hypothetical protein